MTKENDINDPALLRHAPFLERDNEGEFVVKYRPYDGKIPIPVLNYLNRRIIYMDHAKKCYPVDPRDMYHTVFFGLDKVMTNFDPTKLVSASPNTYLNGVVNNLIRNFDRAQVQPRRQEYRAAQSAEDTADILSQAKSDRDAPEGSDAAFVSYATAAEGYTAELGASSMAAQPLTIQQLAENLPATPSADENRNAARYELALIFELLPDEIVRAFTAYIAANGNLLEAAHIAHISKNRFYKKWTLWLFTARRVALSK